MTIVQKVPRRIGLFSGKGGVGKTTLSINLAHHSNRTLVDADPQCSALDWADMRESAQPNVVAAPLARLPRMLGDYQDVIVDMPGNLSGGSLVTLQALDLIVVVTTDKQLELNALAHSVELAVGSGKPAVVLFNKVHPFCDREGTLNILEGWNIPVCPVVIRERGTHYKAMMKGQAAAEYEPDGAAAQEIAALWNWLEEFNG